jgi:penicillin-binding protein 2
MTRRHGRIGLVLAFAVTLAGCGTDSLAATPTPVPTSAPTPPPAAAASVLDRYLAHWAGGDFAAMHAMLAAEDRQRYPLDRFAGLHADLAEHLALAAFDADAAEPEPKSLPPAPRPPDVPAPTPYPTPTPDPSAPVPAENAQTPPPGERPVVEGPRPAMAARVKLTLDSERFGELELERRFTLTPATDGWRLRWTPELLFPELGPDGSLVLERAVPRRGRILAADGSVLAETGDDGVRRYPFDWLAGQAIGYVSEVTADDLATLEDDGYGPGDVVGRSGLEAGAESLLRGEPGWRLSAVPIAGAAEVLYETEPVPGADVNTTLRIALQASAEAALAAHPTASIVALDPVSGDVWAMASTPAFNPNAATSGTSTAGLQLPPPDLGQFTNRAAMAAHPAGSAFKIFTLAAALQLDVASPASRLPCPATWVFEGITFVNYEQHELPGNVSLSEAMAFSCNTTYMPLSLDVYRTDPAALTDLLADFGFGAPTGITHLPEEPGILPDGAWLAANAARSFGPLDQIQLAIGQGAYLGTPLQLANAYAAIANGGSLHRPRLVTDARLPDGEVVARYEPEVRGTIELGPGDFAYLVEALRAVVELPYGTGYQAFAGFGIPVAGKTGTAETPSELPDAWFPAFAPADAPRIVVAAVVSGEPLATGGDVAAPLVRRVMAAHFASPAAQ